MCLYAHQVPPVNSSQVFCLVYFFSSVGNYASLSFCHTNYSSSHSCSFPYQAFGNLPVPRSIHVCPMGESWRFPASLSPQLWTNLVFSSLLHPRGWLWLAVWFAAHFMLPFGLGVHMETMDYFSASVHTAPSIWCGPICAVAHFLWSCHLLVSGSPFMIHCKAGTRQKVIHGGTEKGQTRTNTHTWCKNK